MLRQMLTVFALALLPLPIAAHEFWIDAHKWQVEPGEKLIADIRVGEDLQGPAYAYFPPRIRRFEAIMGDDVYAVRGRAGDKPALNATAPEEGLVVVVHATGDSTVTYSEAETFEKFLATKDWSALLAEHRARGLPDTGFREAYSRYGKALIAVGDGEGSDREVGLATEIVALANPYTDNLSDGLPVRVLYDGAPRADAQVEVFAKAPDGTVEVDRLRTDAAGEVRIPVAPGHVYLVDAVVVRAVEPKAENDPVWESLWASLTFKVPD